MKEKIKRFVSVYQGFLECEIDYTKEGCFILKNSNLTSHEMKLMDFINENSFLKKIEDLFVLKINNEAMENQYVFYFKHKNIKVECLIIEKNIVTSRMLDGTKWRILNDEILEDYELKYKEFEIIINKLAKEIKANTSDRIKFLLKE